MLSLKCGKVLVQLTYSILKSEGKGNKLDSHSSRTKKKDRKKVVWEMIGR